MATVYLGENAQKRSKASFIYLNLDRVLQNRNS